jgi:hypothetical protein
MKRFLLGLALAAAGGLAACGGGNGPQGLDIVYDLGSDTLDGWVDDNGGEDSSRDPGGADVDCETVVFEPADPQDDPLNDYHYVVSLGAQRDVRAKLHACDRGVEGELILFTLLDESYEGACTLLIETAYTEADGIATITLKGGETQGACTVEACVDDGSDTCTTFNILVKSKDLDPLIVAIKDYDGEYAQMDTFQVLLFKNTDTKTFSCDDLAPGKLPSATTSSPTTGQNIQSQYKFRQLPKLEEEGAQTYAVFAQCWESKDLDKTIRAYGCKEGVAVEFGTSRYVEIDCRDIPPKIVGSYEITSTFDMVSGLPPAIANVVNFIIGLFQNPTGQILLLLCDPAYGQVLGGSFCTYLFNDPNDPTLEDMAPVGDIVSTIINAILMGLLADNCPAEDPELCTNIVVIGGDVGSILKKFQLQSTMTCSGEPDKNGLLPMGTCREEWHTVILKWTLGKDCETLPDPETCGEVRLSMRAIPGIDNTVTANIEAQLLPGYALAIAKHPIDLKYGALVNFAIERILLPQIFGNGQDGLPAVDSYEDLVGSLLAGKACLYGGTCCHEFALDVVNQTGNLPGLTTNLVEGACEALITTGAEYLRSQLTGLDTTTENFQIGTPVGDPCPIFDNDKDMKFDGLGTKIKPCNWDAALSIGGASYAPDGTFWGTRE